MIKKITLSYSKGGHIASWCPRCNLRSRHTIIASVDNIPKKIKCNTCDEHHNLNDKPAGKIRTKLKTSARESRYREAAYQEHLSRLTVDGPVNSRSYNSKGNYKIDEIIDHLSFGIGIVLSVIHVNKISIFFKDGPRMLIQNQ